MKTIIKGGRVLDPGLGLDGFKEVLIEDGLIVDVVDPGSAGVWSGEARVIEVKGLLVTPGLVDMHVHLREPGEEYKETIATGTAAAAAGGFTGVAAMANTKPVNDCRVVTEYILAQAKAAGPTRVWPVAAMTRGLAGEELCEYGELAEAGAVALSDDGHWVANSQVMRRILEYSRIFGLTAITHAEDRELSSGGSMNEGVTSTRLGLRGIPGAAEETAVYRDIGLARLTGARLHVAHISTAGSVAALRQAKAEGLPVTGETAPHYFTLTEEAVIGYRTEAKMNPPLRSRADLEAVIAGLADGTIDVIATDHAPHSTVEKDVEFDRAAFGIVGLETALPLTLGLVRSGALGLSRAVAALSCRPAGVLGVEAGTLAPGGRADLTVIDPDRTWVVEARAMKSKSQNTPFQGMTMIGQAVLTMAHGRITHNLLT
jgi:dihydroorotase